MSLTGMMKDLLTLQKKNGVVVHEIRGSVQKDKIYIARSDIQIEKGDELVRRVSYGLGYEVYLVVNPIFCLGTDGIPSCYQVEVFSRDIPKENKAPLKSFNEVSDIVESFISMCITVLTDDSSNYQKHILGYAGARQNLLKLKDVISIPSWVTNSSNIGILKNQVSLKVQGGPGSWERRRNYLKLEMNAMIESYKKSQSKSFSPELQNSYNTRIISSGIPNIQPFTQNMGMPTMGSVSAMQRKKVFIVHGHDETLKHEVYVFLNEENLEPVILHLKENSGQTIIEKLEKQINDVHYAIILYTACDEGKSKKEADYKPRSRQNVVFEHGYLIAKLGRDKVAALKADGVETPGDLQGLVTINTNEDWKYKLSRELNVLK